MRSIRGRLLIMLLSGLGVILVAGGTAVYWIQEASLLQQFDAGLEARAYTVASLVKQEPAGVVFEFGDAPAATIAKTYFEIMLHAGDVVKRSDNLGPSTPPLLISDEDEVGEEDENVEQSDGRREGDQANQPDDLRRSRFPAHAPAVGELVYEDVDLPGDIHGRCAWYTFRPRVDEDDWEGRDIAQANPPLLMVAVALDRGSVDRALGTLLGTLIVVGAVAGVTVGLLVWLGVRWGLRPLERLSRQLGDVSGATLSNRIEDDDTPGELIPVYRELNGMLDRVEQTLQRERSFADAAAHELRAPLAELRATAEVAVKWPDLDRATDALKELLSIGHEMEHLVESLLLISRGHAGAMKEDSPEVSVASILHKCLDRVEESISEKDLNITLDLNGFDILPGPPDAVEIIVRNLIDNAVRYTPHHGSITIRDGVGANGSHGLIVENGPVQLGEDDLARLFEPFWQAQRSRTDRQHVGLGLAVVQKIAGAIGLCVDARLSEDRLQLQVFPAPLPPRTHSS